MDGGKQQQKTKWKESLKDKWTQLMIYATQEAVEKGVYVVCVTQKYEKLALTTMPQCLSLYSRIAATLLTGSLSLEIQIF